MISFKDHQEDIEHELEENRVWSWIKKKFDEIKNFISSLSFGESKTIPLNFQNLSESMILEAGDWHSTVMGVYAEKWAVWSLVNEMDKANLEVINDPKVEKKIATDYEKLLKRSVETGISQLGSDKKLSAQSIKTVKSEMENYKQKGIALGQRAFFDEIIETADSRFFNYEIVHSGGTDAKLSTADMKLRKFSKKEMLEEKLLSLKAYLSSGEKTRGTAKDPFGLLGASIGIPSMTVKTFHRYEKQFEKEFGSDIAGYAKISVEMQSWVKKRKNEIKSNKEVSPYGLTHSDQAKLEAAQKFGHEIIDLQVTYWQKLFEIGLKKKPKEFKQAVLDLLDLGNNASVLLTAGMDKKGQIVTWKRLTPELQELMSTDVEDIDISIDAPEKKLPPRLSELEKAIGKNTKKSSNMNIVFSVDGVELYRVGSQVYTNGNTQFSSTAGNQIKKVNLETSVAEFLGGASSKAEKLIDEEIKRPGSTQKSKRAKRSYKLGPKPNAMQVRKATQKVSRFVDSNKISLQKLSKKDKSEIVDLVARGEDPEDALGRYLSL